MGAECIGDSAMLRSIVESLPGGPVIAGAFETLTKKPDRALFTILSLGALGCVGTGVYHGLFAMDLKVENEIEIESEGRGEVVAVDLDINERPLIGFTADTTDAKTVLNRKLTGRIPIINKKITIPAGSTWVTMGERVSTEVRYDPADISALYDPGLPSSEEDDRLIVKVPLDAFSVENHIEPDHEDFDFHGDWMSLPENYINALTHSFDMLKSVPGIGNIDKAKNKTEEALMGITRVNILGNVADTCTPKVTQNETVYEALHKNIADEALLAVAKSNDPALTDLTVNQLNNMETVVYIGAESDAQPFLPNQNLSFTNPYTDKVTELSKDLDIKFEKEGTFSCELSDEVKQLLADAKDADVTPGPEATS